MWQPILLQRRGFLKPATYRETFEILGKDGILPNPLAKELSALAGFRNVLVHIYWDLDLKQIYAILQRDLVFIEDFAEIMRQHLS